MVDTWIKHGQNFTMKTSHVQIIPESQKVRQFLTVGKRIFLIWSSQAHSSSLKHRSSTQLYKPLHEKDPVRLESYIRTIFGVAVGQEIEQVIC